MAILTGDAEPLRELALFAGAGGGILGGRLLGWRTVCAVECDQHAASVLVARQNDGTLDPFPVWDDVRTFDGTAWRGRIGVVSGGFPCTDISAAGKGAGIEGEESGLWSEFARIIGEVRPRFAYVENSPILTSRGLNRVLGDMAEMGYDARWGCVAAEDSIWIGGDPCLYHERERIWIVGRDSYADLPERRRRKIGRTSGDWQPALHGKEGEAAELKGKRRRARGLSVRKETQFSESCVDGKDSDSDSTRQVPRFLQPERWINSGKSPRVREENNRHGEEARHCDGVEQGAIKQVLTIDEDASRRIGWWSTEPPVGRVVHGMAHRLDRLRALGNGQVPSVARLAWEILTEGWA